MTKQQPPERVVDVTAYRQERRAALVALGFTEAEVTMLDCLEQLRLALLAAQPSPQAIWNHVADVIRELSTAVLALPARRVLEQVEKKFFH